MRDLVVPLTGVVWRQRSAKCSSVLSTWALQMVFLFYGLFIPQNDSNGGKRRWCHLVDQPFFSKLLECIGAVLSESWFIVRVVRLVFQALQKFPSEVDGGLTVADFPHAVDLREFGVMVSTWNKLVLLAIYSKEVCAECVPWMGCMRESCFCEVASVHYSWLPWLWHQYFPNPIDAGFCSPLAFIFYSFPHGQCGFILGCSCALSWEWWFAILYWQFIKERPKWPQCLGRLLLLLSGWI